MVVMKDRGWSGGAMVLGKLPVPGHPTIWITVGQGSTALAVGAGGGCLDIFTLIYPFSPAPCHPGGRNRWLLCACSRWVRPPLYNATVRYTVPSNI